MYKTGLCVLDCPDSCSIEVKVKDGHLVSIDGDTRNPLTDGYICGKVRSQMNEHLYGEDRVRHPLIRCGTKGDASFERVSWDQALSAIAERFNAIRDNYGGEAILPLSYGGSNGLLSQDNTDARYFRRLKASRLARTVCAAPSTRASGAMYGWMPGVSFTDYAEARAIIIWGANPSVTGIHLMPVLQKAKKEGAWIAVVDPRRTGVARIADLHLPLRPGTDLPVALSIARWMFESGAADREFLAEYACEVDEFAERAAAWSFDTAAEVAGVDPAVIAELAERYVTAEPAVVRCGWGLERNRNGGSAVAAVLALSAVAGKFGVRGGGYTMSNAKAWNLDASIAAAEDEVLTRVINMNKTGEVLLSSAPPVKGLFIYNCNPLATLPAQDKVRRGLMREDLFTVVFDQVMTDTARYADVVLPATTFLERPELARSYGAYTLQRCKAVLDPVGESRSNHEVFATLCELSGLAQPDDPVGEDEIVNTILGGEPRGEEIRGALSEKGISFPRFGANPIQFVDVFPGTADGKIHLVSGELDSEAAQRGGLYFYEGDPASELYPIALISPAHKLTVSSTFGQLRRTLVPVEVHPEDAVARGIEEGARVRVFNENTEVHCVATINSSMRAGVAYIPKGTWDHNTLSGNTANALVPDSLTDIAGGACFNDTRVQIAVTE